MMPSLSIVINCDNRKENDTFGGANLLGTVNMDYLTAGLENKLKFFSGFDKEIIIHVDRHNDIPDEVLSKLHDYADVLLIRKHTEELLFNDNNYIRALELATGDIVWHFDADSVAFASSKESVQKYIDLLDKHTVVSYPHWFSPNPDTNANYDYWWASTRCFLCKREFLDLPEIKKCLADNEYMYSQYPASVRNPWLEHAIGLLAKYKGNGVFYPPLNFTDLLIFSWSSYRTGLLNELNNMSYREVIDWQKNHPMHFPNDVNA